MFYLPKKWFTLVELIVVITVLSVLSTIAFLSFSQRSSEARDTLRKSDISTLTKSIGNKIYVDSQNLSNAVWNTSANHTFSTGSVFDTPIWTGSISYGVGHPNVRVFWNDKFYDPQTKDPYIIGYVQGSFGSYYQIWASLEDGTAIIEWIYFQGTWSDLSWIIKDPLGNTPIVNGWNLLPY